MEITCPSFAYGENIPEMFSRLGGNVSPEFDIYNVPDNTKSLALCVHDPDVPKDIVPDGIWYHWVATNIDPSIKKIRRGDDLIGVPCLNSRNEMGYGGPKPPVGETHRYFFTLYACNKEFSIKEGAQTSEVLAMLKEDVIIEKTEYMGIYTSEAENTFERQRDEFES